MKRQLLHNALMGIAALFASIALPAMAQAQSVEGYAVMNVADKPRVPFTISPTPTPATPNGVWCITER